MTDTPASLLERPCDGDWERFVRLFTPLLSRWANRFGVSAADTEDALQEVFVLLFDKLPRFRLAPTGSCRAWLWTVFRRELLARRKRLVRRDFPDPTWRVFWRLAVDGHSGVKVAGTDLDQDGFDDFVVGSGPGTIVQMNVFSGKTQGLTVYPRDPFAATTLLEVSVNPVGINVG